MNRIHLPKATTWLLAGLVWAATTSASLGQVSVQVGPVGIDVGNRQIAAGVAGPVARSTALDGLEVRTPQGTPLGSVEDFLIDLPTGRILYVAVSHGGFAGIGEKSHVVPYTMLTAERGNEEMFFVLPMDVEQLKRTPGFRASEWPKVSSVDSLRTLEAYYRNYPNNEQRPAAP